MSLFSRIKNIIRSNINQSDNEPEIDINSYEDIYYQDSKIDENEEDKNTIKFWSLNMVLILIR